MRSLAAAVLGATMLPIAVCAALAATEVRDAEQIAAFRNVVIAQGYNCPRIVGVDRLDYQTERGQPFMVTCAGGSALGFFYRVTVQPRGTAIVEPWDK